MKIKPIIIVIIFLLFISLLITPAEEYKDESINQADEANKSYPTREVPTYQETVMLPTDIINNIIKKLQPNIPDKNAKTIAELTIKSSEKYNLDSYWMLAMMYVESKFDSSVVSSEGARGLMQIIPSTAEIYGVTKRQLKDPAINIDTGFRYYRYLLDLFKDEKLATIAYNQGPGNVRRGTYKTWYYDRVKDAYNKIITLKEEL